MFLTFIWVTMSEQSEHLVRYVGMYTPATFDTGYPETCYLTTATMATPITATRQ